MCLAGVAMPCFDLTVTSRFRVGVCVTLVAASQGCESVRCCVGAEAFVEILCAVAHV